MNDRALREIVWLGGVANGCPREPASTSPSRRK